MESNSVFISYRRSPDPYLARAIFQDLRAHSIDVFMDVESIDAGQFDKIIMGQIAARPYFLLILTPVTLERCKEPKDWLRREIEQAMNLKRQIVLLHTPNFRFEDIGDNFEPRIAEELSLFNAIEVAHNYFEAAMERLRTRFLKPIDLPATPTPKDEEATVQEKLARIVAEPLITERQLRAQEYFEKALLRPEQDIDGKIADYTEAILLYPQYAGAYNNRGNAYQTKSNTKIAIADFDTAIRLNPNLFEAYYSRGCSHQIAGDMASAIVDFTKALQLNPYYLKAYGNRGVAYQSTGNYQAAIADFRKIIEIDPRDVLGYSNLAFACGQAGDLTSAVTYLTKVIDLDSNNAAAYQNRGWVNYLKGNYEDAIMDCSKAISLNPKDWAAFHSRGSAYASEQKVQDACRDFEQALSLQPDSPKDIGQMQDFITHKCR